ncbi:hypothetical protein C1631_015955 [Chryseobacterium phosphatilyticum]|uniref:Uncharacterized protein n=1 Tax=Chryseobacterium phosphatilyticum TaxID=475075 RepID=A0A316XA01_9FLAO|nr:hypothetical protein [Chryseobacterium phosphatilyticum]PWN68198.1 hypothetical protein C1631_015955 [Chryseobacterium phosphatilyticum]
MHKNWEGINKNQLPEEENSYRGVKNVASGMESPEPASFGYAADVTAHKSKSRFTRCETTFFII